MLQDMVEVGVSHRTLTSITLLTVKFPYFSHRPNEECNAIFLADVQQELTQGTLPSRK